MSLEQQLSQLPRTVLALLTIGAAVILMYILNPPHTICDTQTENAKENLAGILFPLKVKKNTIPPRAGQLQANCRTGNSSGACFEYFNLIKGLIRQLGEANPECRGQITGVSEINAALRGAVETMALLAWGHQPPETPAQRFGWLQESELALFCSLKDMYIKSKGEETWNALRLHINKQFPGQVPAGSTLDVERPKAHQKLSDNEIWTKSIFSIRCENVH